ncbi:ABC transporter substrate-binding protein [Candidatus Cardinium sp. cByotN1]|uniref:ABC transporter substrate-binding protein n=1 Tax=Candidatus Cardinium sp. cByotN1 TaxID=2699439 RepID=UPI001FB1B5BE|nr:ABC transporter substrate-binding protein [Candidatus Cardinium sp. cByotN1]
MISKRTILLLMAVWVFAAIYYKEYKKKQKLIATPTLNNLSVRAINGTDPVRLDDMSSVQVAGKIYEGLYAYHALKRPFQLVPNLAEEMPAISSDGLVYTFKIKKGVLFQDDPCFPNGKGRELKAADFVFSLKRLVDPKNLVPYLGLIDSKIKGLDAWKQQADYAQEVEGLKALDDYTLQVTLTKPWALFLHFLAIIPASVVAKEAVIHYGSEFLNHPVGTGPFILEGGFNPQAKQLIFVKNPTFREKLFPTEGDPLYQPMIDAYGGKKLPLVDKVVTDIITEEQPRWLKMENEEIDMQEVGDSGFVFGLIGEKSELLPKWSKKGLVLHKSPGPRTELFIYNHDHELFKNLYLRQAMSMAFDRETYNQIFYKGTAQVAQSLVPSLLIDDPNSSVAPYGYNIERAKAYLALAGYPGGEGLPVITLDTRSETSYKDKAEFFAKCMAQIGIKIEVITNIWAELYNKMLKRATMMHAMTWSADYPDPATFFELISNKQLVGLQYENPTFNALLDQAMATVNDAERQRLYLALNKMVAQEVPMIYAVHPSLQVLHYNWVKNVTCNDFSPSLDEYIAVDMQQKVKATQ